MHNLCRDIWLHMNQTDLKPLPEHLAPDDSGLTFVAVLQSFTENACVKTINLRDLSKRDETYLASKRISPAHLIRNLEKTLKGRHLDPLAFQLDALKHKVIYAFCPFSGKLVESNQSLLANITVVFYRFETEQVFYVVTAGIGSGFRKSALYLPKHELVVTAGDSWGFEQSDLIELKARMVCNSKACYDYLSDHDRANRRTAVCLGSYHFAHHLWNELSGIHKLYKKRLLDSVDKFLVLREPLGPIEQIFPEIRVDKIERSNSTNDLFVDILLNRYFVVKVGDDYIASDLAARVARVSSTNCLPATIEKVKGAHTKHHPLLWVGIRVANRAWVDQIDGLSNMIDSLQKEFPKLGVVFDGFSLPADRSAEPDRQGFSEILVQENAVVNGIIERLQQRQVAVGVFNIIGNNVFDANVWAHAIDVYVSPYGSLQHKVGWLTNKPGIVHTNQKLLENPAQYVWAAVENGIPPRYVSPVCVSDVRSEPRERIAYNEIEDASESGAGIKALNKKVRGNPELDNYQVKWEVVHHDLVDLIRAPKRRLKLEPLILANRTKRKLRMVVRSITRAIEIKNLV
jgi:hypothetical protein